MQRPEDLLQSSFMGPWVPAAGSSDRRQHVYLSLLHWYEAAKFMPHHPAGRDAIVFSPSLKEARRYARLNQDKWRSDWNLVRPSVLIIGLGLLAIQRPELELRTCPLPAIAAGMEQMGLPQRFLDACLTRFDDWRKGPRVSFFGADLAPESLVGQKASKLVSAMPTWTLLSPCNGRTPWRLHDWSLAHFVPIEYIGAPKDRMSRPLVEKIIERSDRVIVFEARGEHRHDVAIQLARSLKRKLSLELYDNNPATRSM